MSQDERKLVLANSENERDVLIRVFEAVQCAKDMEAEEGLTRAATGSRVTRRNHISTPPPYSPLEPPFELPEPHPPQPVLACPMPSLPWHRPGCRKMILCWRLQVGDPDADPDPAPQVWYSNGAAALLPPEVLFLALMIAAAPVVDDSTEVWISTVLSEEQRWFEVRHAAFRSACQSFHAVGDDRFLLVLVQMGHEWKPPTAKEDKR